MRSFTAAGNSSGMMAGVDASGVASQSGLSPDSQGGGNVNGNVSVAQAVGLLNVLAGLMLVVAILFFVGGFIGWVTRLGLTGRDQGLQFMQWGVSILFVLVVGLGLIRFIQFHTQLMLTLLAVAIVALGAYIAIQIARSSGEAEEVKR